MSKLKNAVLASAGFVILTCSLFFGRPHVTGAQDRGRGITPQAPGVMVENTANNPVPTVAQGTTAIAGSVSLAPGTTVGLDALNNTVKVASSETSPVLVRDVDNPARHPYQDQIILLVPQGSFSGISYSTPVPAGKRLVIEFVSGYTHSPPADGVYVSFITTVSNGLLGHDVVPSLQGPFGQPSEVFGSFSQACKVYADPGTQVGLVMQLLGQVPAEIDTQAALRVSGYLVDVP